MIDPKYRALKFGVTRVVVRDGPQGVHYLQVPSNPFRSFPARMTDRLQALGRQVAPERTFMARRVQSWPVVAQVTGCQVSYAQAWASARNIAQGLINRGLSAERPVVILSENDLEHALLSAGLPGRRCAVSCPLRLPYSLISTGLRQAAPCAGDRDAGPGVRG
jgi:feruloyl-CoA synthase